MRAGVFGLDKAVVLSFSQRMVHSDDQEAQNYLVDADAIFIYQSISKVVCFADRYVLTKRLLFYATNWLAGQARSSYSLRDGEQR